MTIKHDRRYWVDVHSKYSSGISVRTLSDTLNLPIQTIYSAFERMRLSAKRGKVSATARADYFDTIDTETKAYALGLWLADGHVNKNVWVIKLQCEDHQVLQDISDDFYTEPRIVKCKDNCAVFAGYSKNVAGKLRQLFGVSKTSRLKLNIDLIPSEFRGAYIRGIFDGDGSISKRKDRPHQRNMYICSISYIFLADIRDLLCRDYGITAEIFTERRKGLRTKIPGGFTVACHDMHKLIFCTHDSRVKLFELLYTAAVGPVMVRKFNAFKQYYENTVRILACKKPALPDANIACYFARYRQGESIRALGRELGRCSNVIVNWFKRHGYEVRNRVTHSC